MRSSRPLRALRRGAILSFGALVAACGVSTLDDIVPYEEERFDPLLRGTWGAPEGIEGAHISGSKEASYTIRYVDEDGKSGAFRARLGTIAGLQVLDVQPVELEMDHTPLYETLFLRAHSLIVVERVTATELHFRAIEGDSLRSLLEREPAATPHWKDSETIVLTGGTAELQRFLAGFLRRPGVLGEVQAWRRRSSPP